MHVDSLLATTATCNAGITVTSGALSFPASSLVANTLTLGNGLVVTSGAMYANASSVTVGGIAIGTGGASMGNNMVVGTYAIPYTTLALQGNGGGVGTTCQILVNANTNLNAASIAFVDNGSNSATVSINTKTSGSNVNPLVNRFSVSDTTTTLATTTSHLMGTLALPSLNFTGETGTGIYTPIVGNVAIVSQGVASAYATSSGVSVPGNVSVRTSALIPVPGNIQWTKASQTLTTTQYTSAPTAYITSNNSPANIAAAGNVITLTQNLTGQTDVIGYTVSSLTPGMPFTIQMDYNYLGSADGFCMQLWYTNPGVIGSQVGRPVINIAVGYRFTYNIYNISGYIPCAYFLRDANGTSGTSVILANSTVALPSNVWCTYLWQFDGMSTWNVKVSNASNTSQVFMSNTIVDYQAMGIWQAATYKNTLQIQAACGGASALQLMRNLSITTNPGNVTATRSGVTTPQNSNALVLSQSTAYVGIGTSAPLSNVYVLGNAQLGTMTYGSVTSGSGVLPANSTPISTQDAFTLTANSVSVVNVATFSSMSFSKMMVPGNGVQWQGNTNVNMLEVYYGATDRYGMGVYTSGTFSPLRLYTSFTSAPASVCLGKYSLTGGPASTDWIVCNAAGIYHQTQLTMTSNSIKYTGGANTQPIADRSGTFGTYASASTLNFPAFSGLVLVNNANAGGVSLFLVGGNSARCVANSSLTSNTGALVANSTIAGYTWTNTSGATANASFTAIRTNVAL